MKVSKTTFLKIVMILCVLAASQAWAGMANAEVNCEFKVSKSHVVDPQTFVLETEAKCKSTNAIMSNMTNLMSVNEWELKFQVNTDSGIHNLVKTEWSKEPDDNNPSCIIGNHEVFCARKTKVEQAGDQEETLQIAFKKATEFNVAATVVAVLPLGVSVQPGDELTVVGVTGELNGDKGPGSPFLHADILPFEFRLRNR